MKSREYVVVYEESQARVRIVQSRESLQKLFQKRRRLLDKHGDVNQRHLLVLHKHINTVRVCPLKSRDRSALHSDTHRQVTQVQQIVVTVSTAVFVRPGRRHVITQIIQLELHTQAVNDLPLTHILPLSPFTGQTHSSSV